MNIIVVGCGKIGTTVLESLVAEGHDVTAVDNRPLPLTDITNIHDVMTVCGNGADCETQAWRMPTWWWPPPAPTR